MDNSSGVRLSELREARHRTLPLRRADFLSNKGKSTSRQSIAKLLKSNLSKVGFEFDQFDTLIQQSETEVRQRAAYLTDEAKKNFPAVQEDLHRTLVNLVGRIDNLKALGFPTTQYFWLDTATEISTFGIAPPIHERSGPGPTAKFDFNASGGDEGFGFADGGQVSFGFLWQNSSQKSAVVDVHGYIVLDGGFDVTTDGGYVVLGNFSHLWVDVDLFIHELWNQPPTSPVAQPTQSQNALDLDLFSYGVILPGEIDGQNLYRGFDLQYSQFVIPPKAMAMFEVACTVNAWMSNGQAQASFSDPFHQLLCPGVLLAVTL
jgi:hypothetical protein